MKRFSLVLVFSLITMLLFSGCAKDFWQKNMSASANDPINKKEVIRKINKDDIKQVLKEQQEVMRDEKMLFLNSDPEKVFTVVGEGIAPAETISPAQALVLAKRAAIADGYRQFGEKLYGGRISAKDTIKDAALQDSRIVTQVSAVIKNAEVLENSYVDGLYRVTMELKVETETWKRIFSY